MQPDRNLKRTAITARQTPENLRSKADINTTNLARNFNISISTLRTAMKKLKALDIVKEISGKGKQRHFIHEFL